MEENKNYTEPENIEQETQVEPVEADAIQAETTEPKQPKESKNAAPKKEKKPLGKKQWIIIGAVALVVIAIVVGVVIWLASGNKDETPPEETTTLIGTWYPAEYPEDYPFDADPKQEDVFYD